jgi:hypothetical protein|tara:strand:- start:40 stop:591 length:552 start_codon:yes stop_codon:yes gene_type:complete
MAIEQYYNNPNYLAAIDDAGLEEDSYENFAQIANPGFNFPYAQQLGSGLVSLFTQNPMAGLITRGIGYLGDTTRLPGVVGGVDLRGDTGLDTFRRSTSFADFFQRQRNKKAREDAAKIGEMKQKALDLDYEYNAYTGGNQGGNEGGHAGGQAAADAAASQAADDRAAGAGGYRYGGLASLFYG